MLIFAELNFTTASVMAGEPCDREFVIANLSALSQRLDGIDDFKTRLLVPPEDAIDQWWESRLAVCKCAEEMPGPLFASISHTNGISVAAIHPKSSGILGIGIDIEIADRIISSRAEERIQRLVPNSVEPELIRWTRYEAAYKACYGNRELKHVIDGQFGYDGFEIETEVRKFEHFVVSVAIAKTI